MDASNMKPGQWGKEAGGSLKCEWEPCGNETDILYTFPIKKRLADGREVTTDIRVCEATRSQIISGELVL